MFFQKKFCNFLEWSLGSLIVFHSSPRPFYMPFFFILLLKAFFVELSVWRIWRQTCFSYLAMSKTGSKGETSHKPWSRCASVWEYLFFFVWRMDELLCMIHLSSLFSMDVDYLSLFFSFWHALWACGISSLRMYLSFFIFFFLTCLLSMWHTFFGYASFISFLHRPHPLWSP